MRKIHTTIDWSVGARLLRKQRELKTLQRAERVKRLKPCPRKASAETKSNRLIPVDYLYINKITGKRLTIGKKASVAMEINGYKSIVLLKNFIENITTHPAVPKICRQYVEPL